MNSSTNFERILGCSQFLLSLDEKEQNDDCDDKGGSDDDMTMMTTMAIAMMMTTVTTRPRMMYVGLLLYLFTPL